MEFWDFKDNADKDYLAAEDAAEKLEDKKAKDSQKKNGGKKMHRL
jgi:hypothetical protein